jgi:hypothetical protein
MKYSNAAGIPATSSGETMPNENPSCEWAPSSVFGTSLVNAISSSNADACATRERMQVRPPGASGSRLGADERSQQHQLRSRPRARRWAAVRGSSQRWIPPSLGERDCAM